MNFQKTVMMVALILFIAIMAVVAVLMTNNKKKAVFPPEIGVCPDYWELTKIKVGTTEVLGCKDVNNIGNSSGTIPNKETGNCSAGINFKDAAYATKKAKCTAAKACGVEWDGITNIGIC